MLLMLREGSCGVLSRQTAVWGAVLQVVFASLRICLRGAVFWCVACVAMLQSASVVVAVSRQRMQPPAQSQVVKLKMMYTTMLPLRDRPQ